MIVSNKVVADSFNISSVVLNDKDEAIKPANLELRSMEAKRIYWEDGAFRTSNQALYQVLAECLVYSGELTVSMAKLRNAALANFYKERGYKYKEDTPLVTRVVRAVFGDIDRRRISTYSLVLRQAQKENISCNNLASWIEERGGIQEIRLSRSPSFISASQKASVGKMYFEGKPDLGVVQSEFLSVEADPGFIGQACVLLAEQQADGSFSVRAVIRNPSALNAAYSALYAKQKTSIAKAEAEVAAANDADGALALQG
ncbi:hypothetical protein NHB34_08755 [Polynucleobacter sp. MWH-UH19D]|uniref:hypothetical protein n=1 Tax=Polynucleobacter sp. MWH-UH19D TaxID=1855610 RepID=UPI003364E8AB